MFITLEGIEGCGKSTLIKTLCQKLEENGYEVYSTREPGGSDLGQKLRSILLHAEQKICPEAELFLFLADRAQHVNLNIKDALSANKIVLCDRYIHSTIAYQGYGRGLDVENLRNLNDKAINGLYPDLTVLLDLEVETGLNRAASRHVKEGTEICEGRFEREALDFHAKVRQGFLEMAKEDNKFFVIDATLEKEIVAETAWKKIQSLL